MTIPRTPEIASPIEAESRKKILKNLRFQKESALPTASSIELNKFTSSEAGRKIAILDFGQAEPDPTKSYDVEVVRDTKPQDPLRGAFIVRIINKESTAPVTEETIVPMEEKKEAPYIPLPIERDEVAGRAYVLETEIPLNPEGGERVPKAEHFKHFTLDQRTLETLEKIATGIELREPVLLEGETSTSKTSSIEYLAMITGNEVARFNLNGQTDTSELIGKFIPNDGQLQVAFEELLRSSDNLSQKSQAIVKEAKNEGRGLTLIESQQIANAESLKVPDWRWQDGIDVRAKKKGQWLILDEINLAEAQILERINSQLEKNPSITLTENGGVVIKDLNEHEMGLYREGKLSGVEPLHSNFRIFATMNPAEYAGRQPMSPAYKDRWTSYKFVSPPNAKDYAAMMGLMVYGEQPEVVIRGQKYASPRIESGFPLLERIPNFRSFTAKIAKFQEKIEELAKHREIGKNKKEPYIFTRRGLIEFLTYLERKTVVDRKTKKHVSVNEAPKEIVTRAIQYYYLDKISHPDDLKKVRDQLDIIGVSESNWTHKFK
ncbi:MAG: AAA family ATPase [Candidatus Azambacteria bacterium]|nr:AAA family ATPase [Candidatus Azambacteria bacterium]